MKSLESELEMIGNLRGDLFANLQNEEGYWEESDAFRVDDPKYDPNRPSTYFVRTKEAVPDEEKRNSAQTQLLQIYDSSEWYSARYSAGRNLGIDVTEKIPEWINELRENLNADIIVQEKKSHIEVIHHDGLVVGGERADSYRWDEDEIIIDQPEIKKPDIEKRKKADADLTALISRLNYSEKIELYKSHNYDIRTKAGKALGYSNFRIWLHNLF